MGKLLHTYADGPEIMTRPHWFYVNTADRKKGQQKPERKFIPTKVQHSYDPSDANYETVLGRLRRRPTSLPWARRAKG